MPGSAWAWAIIALVVLALVILWFRRRSKIEEIIAKEREHEMERQRLEAARKAEREAAEAADKARRESGPIVPPLDSLRPQPGDRPPPAGTKPA